MQSVRLGEYEVICRGAVLVQVLIITSMMLMRGGSVKRRTGPGYATAPLHVTAHIDLIPERWAWDQPQILMRVPRSTFGGKPTPPLFESDKSHSPRLGGPNHTKTRPALALVRLGHRAGGPSAGLKHTGPEQPGRDSQGFGRALSDPARARSKHRAPISMPRYPRSPSSDPRPHSYSPPSANAHFSFRRLQRDVVLS